MEKSKHIKRKLDLVNLLSQKSFFLFGPRATGKTWLIKHSLPKNSHIINLLETDTYTRFLANPEELRGVINLAKKGETVVIDEIQKVPALLDEVHLAIEEHNLRFLLTGSSARKLRTGGINLLAGRAWRADLFPLTSFELKDKFNLDRYLLFGGLPMVFLGANPLEELFAYVDTYLKEEVRAEALVRNLPGFSRFLKTAALSDGQIINYTKIANDAQLPPSTVREYFGILEDTLIGFTLPSWKASKKRKAVQSSKFFLFDPGVSNILSGIHHIPANSSTYGLRFEQLIGMELRAYLSYSRIHHPLTYWRSVNGQEVDFLLGDRVAIEVQTTNKISSRHRKGLMALRDETVFQNYYVVSFDPLHAKHDKIEQLHWKPFLERLWSGEII